MKFTGKQILESEELRDLLQNYVSRVMKIVWHDGSITDGLGKDIRVEYVGELNETKENLVISVVDGLWSEPITNNMILTIENPNMDLYNVFTTTEAALLWGKEESTVRKACQSGRFEQWKDYRKSGRITLITKEAMERVYGKMNKC